VLCSWLRQSSYNGSAFARPCCRLARRVPAWGAALSLALISGGCSFSYQLDSMFSRQRDADVETSGSLRPTALRQQSVATATPQDGDLAAARGAVSEALGKNGRDASVPWEDHATGARGTVTALSNAYNQDGATCRDFLASYVRNGSESWLEGEACRGVQGRWEVRHIRPWRRT
jgi:surface antigen